MNHSPAQMAHLGLNSGSTASDGNLKQVHFFNFTGEMMISDSAILELHENLDMRQIH